MEIGSAASHMMTLAKAVTWRIIAGLNCLAQICFVAWVASGKLQVAVGLGVVAVDCLIEFPLYYAHERLWTWTPLNRLFS